MPKIQGNMAEAKSFIDEMKRKRGYLYPAYEYLVRNDLEYLKAYEGLASLLLQRNKYLTPKVKELIFIAAIASRSPSDREAIRNHMKRGLSLGLTREEIMEALEVAMLPAGALALVDGIEVLLQLTGK